jgi:hypothetical protein
MMNTDGERARPGVLCDVCFKPIEEASDGNAQWFMGGEVNGGAVYFTHKACRHAFDTADDDTLTGAHELSHFLVFLANNLKVDWEKAKKGAAMIASIG